ncbi:MAG: YaiI/YqxD family protein [Oligoflexia bacterium]|nr:YaiI/YqxD family protein [Oligoflexia bacterium]MBF0364531.1 YaiI/YqxD family protein [Oligoflexia bacterium]
MKIWTDADACPKIVKELIFKTAFRLNLSVILVANSHMAIPLSPLISLVVVKKQIDEADHYILEHVEVGDLVVTADIPLASALVAKGVVVLNPRGNVYSEDNVGEALATRNLLQELRDGGLIQGGPAPLNVNDKVKFANALDKELTKLIKQNSR